MITHSSSLRILNGSRRQSAQPPPSSSQDDDWRKKRLQCPHHWRLRQYKCLAQDFLNEQQVQEEEIVKADSKFSEALRGKISLDCAHFSREIDANWRHQNMQRRRRLKDFMVRMESQKPLVTLRISRYQLPMTFKATQFWVRNIAR